MLHIGVRITIQHYFDSSHDGRRLRLTFDLDAFVRANVCLDGDASIQPLGQWWSLGVFEVNTRPATSSTGDHIDVTTAPMVHWSIQSVFASPQVGLAVDDDDDGKTDTLADDRQTIDSDCCLSINGSDIFSCVDGTLLLICSVIWDHISFSPVTYCNRCTINVLC